MKRTDISMLRYIQETPDTIRCNLARSEALTEPLTSLFVKSPWRRVVLVACGSSYNASLCAHRYMKAMLGIPVEIITPFTFNNYAHDVSGEDFVLCISQSGCSTNTIESLHLCRSLGIPAIGITGNIHSDFEREADLVVDFGLNEEKLDFVTKGVVAQTVFLDLFALHAACLRGLISQETVEEQKAEIAKAVDNYEHIVNTFEPYFQTNRKALLSMHTVYCIGAGANYGTALEGAVKIGETIHVPAIGYEVEEAIHGPQIQLTPDYTFVFLDPGDHTAARFEQAYRAAKAITDRVFILSNNPAITGPGVFRVPQQVAEPLSPIYGLAFIQMLTCTVAETANTWPTHPLLKDYKVILNGKSTAYQAYDCT